jgi:hypothetical protein
VACSEATMPRLPGTRGESASAICSFWTRHISARRWNAPAHDHDYSYTAAFTARQDPQRSDQASWSRLTLR